MQGLQSKWFVVHAIPRMESVALKDLERQGFHCFLPLTNTPCQRFSNTNNQLIEPLFSRYMFQITVPDVHELGTVRSTSGMAGRSP